MTQPQSNLKNLSEGSEESLRALIQAIIPEAADASSNRKLGPDAIEKLTQKLTELMGPEAAEAFQQGRNERGEMLNEEGLPIIEITEPDDATSISMASPATVEPLVPLASLSPLDRERMRKKRDRILDLLEEEERQIELREQERRNQENDEALQKRTEDTAKQKEKLKEAKELQKKMGRALLKNIGRAKEVEEQEREAQRLKDEQADLQRKSPSGKKKTVAFVENPESMQKSEGNEVIASSNWGDVTPARLQNTKRATLASQSLLDMHPMKMSVVERLPGGQGTLPKSPLPLQNMVDSDDESDEGSNTESSEDYDEMIDVNPILETDEFEFDFAQQQREIALEYYNKRNTIGQATAAAIMNHSHELDVHREATTEPVREGQKPVMSQFRAQKLASAYGASAALESESVSLGESVLPASSTRTIQRAIKTGKLDLDGKLVGAEADSESDEEDHAMREVLELLKKGEVYNLGPNGEYLHTVHPNQIPQTHNMTVQPSSGAQGTPQRWGNMPPPPPLKKPTVSKFKASLAASGRPGSKHTSNSSTSLSNISSPSVTPVFHDERSSPKLDLESRKFVKDYMKADTRTTDTGLASKVPNSSNFSMIVESPSFPKPREGMSSTSSLSYHLPAETSRRPERPPAVISTVRESTPQPTASAHAPPVDETKPGKKISKFKAERM
ncbi:hypothetical protein JR316_0003386 [Psilocybe cubensis]|uniref:Uncharacterized protein n=2 Tax=Psilocybe cubensis TaxID=181762 RepID=A0ACB8H7K4_PSICU|nr:hypothetical protein JR316_0003386 [Psilocybe cubensis]KAH9483908.1 hypothetical protein JR316_0003386 [Psilocybe cubensis]